MKQQLLPQPPKEVPRSILHQEILVNCESQRRLGPASSASCKAKGGPHLTHNTKECRRYNGNRNPISSLQGKPVNAKKLAKKEGDQQMAYLMAAVESLVKKGLKKR